MSVYGTKGKVIKGEILQSLTCPNCGNRSHRSFGVLRYFHLCGVPVFPVMERVGIECTACRWTLLDRQIPEKVRQGINSNIFERKHLLPIVSG